ncbi:hypothetical protein EVG20_g322 [Dentipellis fragilis]|uniref:Mitotic checkpoint regulator, MAD2B-interacting-domain-containing protein n=1 Tax=Dentipellis fragilis TaxID=205917 RepID=A0A4Y9ZDY0_9AGAM|nr:hypothetical protein EVG20_g322 [Dentipellis fragilis]
MLVDNYGSDSDSDHDSSPPLQPAPKKPSAAPQVKSSAKGSSLSLPPPSNASGSKSTGLALPAPKTKRPAKKIAIDLPALPPDEDDNLEDTRPPAKKPRLEPAGLSSLFSMLPAPKQKNPLPSAPERVLGSGKGRGLVFNASRSRPVEPSTTVEDDTDGADAVDNDEKPEPPTTSSLPFLPPSLGKGRSNISLEDGPRAAQKPKAAPPPSSAPSADFFSLGERSSTPGSSSTPSSSSNINRPTVSSAPKVDDFVPPEPTPNDPYPGYYMLPSGNWAAYDTSYYQKFYSKWKADYDAQVRALEKKAQKGFEGAEDGDTQEVNAMREMEKAKYEIQEREEKKALTQGAGATAAAPKMNVQGAKLGNRARSRHQLTTLLTEAYQNREALEQRIADGRRNRKEAGNKYGF